MAKRQDVVSKCMPNRVGAGLGNWQKPTPVVGKTMQNASHPQPTKRFVTAKQNVQLAGLYATARVELFCPSVDVCAVRPLPCFAVAFLFCNGNASCKNSVPKFWEILFAKAIAVLLFRRLFSKQWFWTKHACFSSVCSQQIFECEQV